jgi:uncharacterized protein
MNKVTKVESFKYPDEPRYFYPAHVIGEKDGWLVLFRPSGSSVWSGKVKRLIYADSFALELFHSGYDYNVIIFWDKNWNFKAYYINIALPAAWNDTVCSYVDLELDVLFLTEQSLDVIRGKRTPGTLVLDRDEFEERKELLNFPQAIIDRAEQAVLEVLQKINQRDYPFDDSWLNWRPAPDQGRLEGWLDSTGNWRQAS